MLDDVYKLIDGGGNRNSRPIIPPFQPRVNSERSNTSYQEEPKISRIRQPDNFERYPPVNSQQPMNDLSRKYEEDLFKIFSGVAERTKEAARQYKEKTKALEQDLLPEEAMEKIDQNRYDIEVQEYTIEGHKTTISNALHYFNGKDWEDLHQIGSRCIKALEEHDAYTADQYSRMFINGVFATMPAYLSMVKCYEDIVEKAKEIYDLALTMSAKDLAELTEYRNKAEPAEIINKQTDRIKQLELDLAKVNAELAEKKELAPPCMGGYDKEDEYCNKKCTLLKRCKKESKTDDGNQGNGEDEEDSTNEEGVNRVPPTQVNKGNKKNDNTKKVESPSTKIVKSGGTVFREVN
jgi:hypothetical protein